MQPTAYEKNAPSSSVVDHALSDTRLAYFWIEDVPDAPTYDALSRDTSADLVVVGGGYCGLWTAVLAKRRNPSAKVVLIEAERVGWAASGRNGGFCEASLTHGEENGQTRWPDEYALLERLGEENLEAFEQDLHDLKIDAEFESTGVISMAVEDHQVEWLREESGFLDEVAVRREINSPLLRAGSFTDDSALVHPAKLATGLGRAAAELGVEIFEHTKGIGLSGGRGKPVVVETEHARITADRVVLATNVFPSLIKRSRLYTVPVYDYVLMTEPLSVDQRESVGWQRRQGLGDVSNQFHYSRLTAGNRILFGGYDAIYHFGREVKPQYENRSATYERLASHFFALFPQLEGLRFSHKWAGAIDTSTQFCAFHGLAYGGRVAYAAGFTGLGVGATRFAAEVMLDRLAGLNTERTELEMVRKKPLPFPPEPIASAGINLTRWSLDRADRRGGQRNLYLRTLDKLGLGFDS